MEKEIILHAFSIELQSHLTSVLAFAVIPITETWKWRSVIYSEIIKLWNRFPWLPSYVQKVPHNGAAVAPGIIPGCIVKRGILETTSENESHTERNNLPTANLNWYNTFSLTFKFYTEVIRNLQSCLQLLTARMTREKFGSLVLFCWYPFYVFHCVAEKTMNSMALCGFVKISFNKAKSETIIIIKPCVIS